MRIGLWMAVAGMAAMPVAAIAAGGSLWHYTFQNGIAEYLTGEWDATTGGALNLSCRGKGVSIMPQIRGQAPPANSRLRLTASSRAGSRETAFMTDAQGSVQIADAGASAAFRQLWGDLRGRDIVTVRYADGRQVVLSLAGAQKTLPTRPCG
ncbi:hypothetical protein [Sphingobium sp.]|uniref:hypothetical protein n=1 Tax=Sphingobium sp. TaxID=1912891 RepID=UPI003BB6177C